MEVLWLIVNPFMLSQLPIRKTVRFREVNWAVEAHKSQLGFERRSQTRQRRKERKDSHRITKMEDKKLQSFLQFAVSADEKAAQIIGMDFCDFFFLRQAKKTKFVIFKDDETDVNKVKELLKMLDSLKKHRVLRHLILTWMDQAIDENLYSIPDDESLAYSSSISSKASKGEDSEPSQVATVDIDLEKVKELGWAIALLEVDEIENQLKAMDMEWEKLRDGWDFAQPLVNEVIKKIKALELRPEDLLLRDRAIALFQKETDSQTRVQFLCLALRENTVAAVLADSSVEESRATRASTAEQRGT